MSLTFDESYKNQIGCKITIRMGKAIQNNEVNDDDLEELCNYILVAIEETKSIDDMLSFLSNLSNRWPCFSEILDEVKGTNSVSTNIENQFQNRTTITP